MLSEIGRALGKHAGSFHGVLSANRGIAPFEKKRRKETLSFSERDEISRCLASQCFMRSFAQRLGRAPSTISREINCNAGIQRYRASVTESNFIEKASRPKPCKLATNRQLNAVVADRLQKDWSPQQIAGWLARTYVANIEMQVSHETIYRSLFIQARGLLKRELISHLRSHRMMRRDVTATISGQPRGQIIDAVSIRDSLPMV